MLIIRGVDKFVKCAMTGFKFTPVKKKPGGANALVLNMHTRQI
jgi:hypothetical protein